jgi:uncharacterized protein YycO
VRAYTLLTRSNGGWKEVADFNAVDVSAAKKMADDYASTIGVGPNDVAVEEIAGVRRIPASPTGSRPPTAGLAGSSLLAAGVPAAGAPSKKPPAAGLLAAGPAVGGVLEKMNKAYPVRNGKEIGIGKKIESKWIRAERWASSIKVTDLQNAGKRGKKVDRFDLYDLDYIRGKQPTTTNLYLFESSLPKLDYETAEKWAMALVEDAALHHHHIGFQMETERGVDVEPAGFEKVTIQEKHFYLNADNKGFTISDLDDPQNEPRAISLDKHGKKNAKKFYEWALKNKNNLSGKTFYDVLHMMEKENIGYHTYCGMD